MRLDSVRTAEQAIGVFEEIQYFGWQGFAEKDEVIERVIRAFALGQQNLGTFTLDDLRARALMSPWKEVLRKRLCNAW